MPADNLFDPLILLQNIYPFLRAFFIVIVLFIFCNIIISWFHSRLSKKAHTRRQKSNIEIFFRFIKYCIFLSIIFGVLFRFSASFQQFGLVLGALTAALGFALQRPIGGVAAWIMLILKRPFDIGDRVIIGDVKGNVIDISLTHIHLEEVGRYGGEEVSGRMVIVPNSMLFEKNITNYSLQDDYILGQVIVTVTFESNIEKALVIVIDSARKFTIDEHNVIVGKEPHTRLSFGTNGMEIHVRYYVPFGRAQEIATNVTQDIFNMIRQSPDIEIAYPHTKVILEKE